MVKLTAELPEDFKVCETCKYYDPEGKLNMGVCTKLNWPVLVEALESCDQWEAEE